MAGSKRSFAEPSAVKSAHGNRAALSFVIPSEYAAGRDVQRQIMADVASHNFNADAAYAIKLALEEAITNAIKHGNQLDHAKKVYVTAKVTDDACEIQIEDEGPGFRREHVPDPCADENIEKCTGRGIMLMEAYMNLVTYDRGGRRVKLIKKNEHQVHPRR